MLLLALKKISLLEGNILFVIQHTRYFLHSRFVDHVNFLSCCFKLSGGKQNVITFIITYSKEDFTVTGSNEIIPYNINIIPARWNLRSHWRYSTVASINRWTKCPTIIVTCCKEDFSVVRGNFLSPYNVYVISLSCELCIKWILRIVLLMFTGKLNVFHYHNLL